MKTSAVLGAAGLFVTALAMSACSPATQAQPAPSVTVAPAAEQTLMAYTLEEALAICRSEFKADPAEQANCEAAANNTEWAP